MPTKRPDHSLRKPDKAAGQLHGGVYYWDDTIDTLSMNSNALFLPSFYFCSFTAHIYAYILFNRTKY